MNRSELEHVLRAAGAITLRDDFVVIGSQAVLGQFPDAPAEVLVSREVDLYPRDHPDDSILIDGAIGEGSTFHDTFGYYAHGVGPETAVLSDGWERRLIRVHGADTGGATGWCLEVHDLAASKIVAGRDRDLEFVTSLLSHGLIQSETLRSRLDETPMEGSTRAACTARLERLADSDASG